MYDDWFEEMGGDANMLQNWGAKKKMKGEENFISDESQGLWDAACSMQHAHS